MKKAILPILALVIILSGCFGAKPAGDPKAINFSNGKVTLGMSIEEANQVLGNGEEKAKGIYSYGDTTLMIMEEKVFFILTTDAKATTDRGIKIGDKIKKIQKSYGKDANLMTKNDDSKFYEVLYKDEDGAVTVTAEKPYNYYLGMNIEEDKVTKIVLSDNTKLGLN